MKHFITILFLLISITLSAQYQVGVSASNYAGVKSMNLNPSSIADSRYKFNFYIGGVDQNLSNSFVKWTAPFPFWALFAVGLPIPNSIKTKIEPTRVSIDLKTNKAKLNINTKSDGTGDFDFSNFVSTGNNIKGNASMNIDLLSFQADIPKIKSTIGFGMRLRTMLDFRNNSLFTTLLFAGAGADSTVTPINTNFTNQSINLKISSFHETGFTFAKSIFNNGQQSLKGGLTLKYYKGIFHLGMQADNATVSLSKTTVTLTDGSPKQVNQINVPKADYVSMRATSDATLTPFIDEISLKPYNLLNPFWMISSSKSPGRGIGGSLGFTYEFLDPDMDFESRKFKGIEKTQNKYIFKLGVSLNDIGKINYGYSTKAKEESKSFEKKDLNNGTNGIPLNVFSFPKFKFKPDSTKIGFIDKWFGYSAATFADSLGYGYSVGLPSNLVINVDYKLMKNLYIGGMLVQNVSFVSQKYAQPAPSVLAILPRYETRLFDASLPIMLTNNYSNLQIGLGLRAGPVFIGTDHLISFLNLRNTKGADIYMGATVPIFYKSTKKSTLDVGIYDDRTFMEKLREKLYRRHLKKLHRKEMKRG